MEESTVGMAGIAVIGLGVIGAIVYGGDGTKITEVVSFGTAICGMIAALVRGTGGGSSQNGG